MILVLCIVLGAIALDQITKLIVANSMELGESIPIIKKVLHLTYIENKGAAFGSMSNSRWVFIILSLVAIAALSVYVYKNIKKLDIYAKIGCSLIIGGGIGNMIDRTFYGDTLFNGAVVDFIDFKGFGELWTWVFNVADACVCVGVGFFALSLILEEVREYKKRKQEKLNKQN